MCVETCILEKPPTWLDSTKPDSTQVGRIKRCHVCYEAPPYPRSFFTRDAFVAEGVNYNMWDSASYDHWWEKHDCVVAENPTYAALIESEGPREKPKAKSLDPHLVGTSASNPQVQRAVARAQSRREQAQNHAARKARDGPQ